MRAETACDIDSITKRSYTVALHYMCIHVTLLRQLTHDIMYDTARYGTET